MSGFSSVDTRNLAPPAHLWKEFHTELHKQSCSFLASKDKDEQNANVVVMRRYLFSKVIKRPLILFTITSPLLNEMRLGLLRNFPDLFPNCCENDATDFRVLWPVRRRMPSYMNIGVTGTYQLKLYSYLFRGMKNWHGHFNMKSIIAHPLHLQH